MKSIFPTSLGMRLMLKILSVTIITPLIAHAAPPTPALYSPQNGATDTPPENTSFSWSSSGVGVSYRIVVSSDQGFLGFNNKTETCDSTCGTSTTTATKHTRTLSLYGKKYFWKVKSYNSSGSSAWSQTYYFTTKASKLSPPFSANQTWYICQGYNGGISHNIPIRAKSLDLSYSSLSIGTTGCTPSTKSSSAGQPVLSPDNGTIAWIGASNPDITCINLDSGGSMKIGHFYSTVKSGRISKNQMLGTLTNAGTGTNNGYAHIHMQLYSKSGCPDGLEIEFGTVFGSPNLYYSGTIKNQWSGSALYK